MTIPFTAWDQAVFVCLFLILVVAVLSWMSKENNANRKFQSDQAKEWQDFMDAQNKKNEQISLAVKSSLDGVTAVVSRLADEVRTNNDEIRGQRSEFSAHDEMERAKLDEMSKRIHESPRPGRRTGDKGA